MVFEKLRDIIVEQLGVSAEDVTMESSIENDLGADSLDLVEIVMAIEEEFDFEVSEDDVEGIDTIGKAVEYIKSRVE
jgi:acyl carrier protein